MLFKMLFATRVPHFTSCALLYSWEGAFTASEKNHKMKIWETIWKVTQKIKLF